MKITMKGFSGTTAALLVAAAALTGSREEVFRRARRLKKTRADDVVAKYGK